MKKILIAIIVLATISCGTQKTAQDNSTKPVKETVNTPELKKAPEPEKSLAQKVNGHLLGKATKADLMNNPYNSWFNSRYDAYQVDSSIAQEIGTYMKDVDVRLYMGTWCGDSKRETPMFYKLMEEAGVSESKITLITVDRSKSKPVDLVEGYNVVRVPTIIFYRDGQELGRYVERPRESLEKDILKIVSGQEYKHSYQN